MTVPLDEVDRRIIYALMEDARNISAPMIAEGLDVSAGTIRNRIERLEDGGVIRGYTADIDFEQADSRLTSMYMCTVPAADRERLASAAQSIPGVINVRVLMAGRRDLQVVAVGESTEDLREIARALSELDIEIEDEELLQTTLQSPYGPFGPDSGDVVTSKTGTPVDRDSVIEVTVAEQAPIAGVPLEVAQTEGHLDEVVVISIQRDGDLIRPTKQTVFQPNDVVALHTETQSVKEFVEAFRGPVET
jgi:transcriptional regulator, AsnC family